MLRRNREFHTVIRSAGSRSPFDVVAIGESRVLLCQVKTGQGSFTRDQERLRLLPVPRYTQKQLRRYQNKEWTTIPIP